MMTNILKFSDLNSPASKKDLKNGTLQKKCIANYMGEPRDWEFIYLLAGNVGIIFIIALINYLYFI